RDGEAEAANLAHELRRHAVIAGADEILDGNVCEAGLFHVLYVLLRDAVIPKPDELVERGRRRDALRPHRLDVIGRDAVVARANEVFEGGRAVAEALEVLDVLDGDAMGFRALDVVERQFVEAFSLERADVFRTDVVNGELEPTPDRQVVGIAERPHLGGVLGARREGEEAGAAPVAECAVEGQGAGFAAQLGSEIRNGELVVVAGQPAELVNRDGLPHVPVAAPLVAVPIGGRGGANLEKYLAFAKLGGPGPVDVALGRYGGRGQKEGSCKQISHAPFDRTARSKVVSFPSPRF